MTHQVSKPMSGLRTFRVLSVGLAIFLGFDGNHALRAKTGAAAGNESDTVRGTVLNRVTNEPIGRALVSSYDNQFATLTDSSGHFEFKVPAPQPQARPGSDTPPAGNPTASRPQAVRSSTQLVLQARKPGFLSEEESHGVFVSPGGKDITIYLLPEARVVGRVTAPERDLPERFVVQLYRRFARNGLARWVPAGYMRTWSNGEYRFAGLYPGSYKVFTGELAENDPSSADLQGPVQGYPPVYYPSANTFTAGSVIRLSAGATFQADLTPARREYYPVEIKLSNAPPAAVFNVTVSPAGERGPGYTLGYNPQGSEIQGYLPDGSYIVEVSNSGPAATWGSASITVNGGPATNYSVTLLPNITIPVHVTQEFTRIAENSPQFAAQLIGQSAVRVPIDLTLLPDEEFDTRQGGFLHQPERPDDGVIEIENLRPGRYWVEANSGLGYVASVQCGETDLLRRPLVVTEGGSHDPIEVTLRDDGASLKGTIENMPAAFRANEGTPMTFSTSFSFRGRPLPFIYLLPLPDSSGQLRQTWARPDGTFILNQIPPGDYRVVVFDGRQRQLEYRNAEEMRKHFSAEQEISLQAGQSVQLQVHMISGSD